MLYYNCRGDLPLAKRNDRDASRKEQGGYSNETKEELDALKEEVKAVNEKLQELTEEEIAQVSGGKAIECVKILCYMLSQGERLSSKCMEFLELVQNGYDNDCYLFLKNAEGTDPLLDEVFEKFF